MKKEINDLLLKMQTGENCIGETANKLLNLFNIGFSSDEVDLAYFCGVFNTSGMDGLSEELKRLEKLGKKPHDIIEMYRYYEHI